MNDEKEDERGQIINVSSAAATEGQTGHVTLSAVSGAINSMTLPMARDLANQSKSFDFKLTIRNRIEFSIEFSTVSGHCVSMASAPVFRANSLF